MMGPDHVDIPTFNGLSLCSGVGGLELGLKLALGEQYRTVCYVEREAFCAATLVARMEDEALDRAPIWDDLATFDGKAWRGVVDIVTAGYPCQPFSTAGKRLGTRDERHLWPHVARIIRECRPRYVFCENVDRHLSVGFDEVSGELEGMGYVVAAGLFTAAEVGLPHRRRRLFFLAGLDGERGRSELAHTRRITLHANEPWRGERESGPGSSESEQSGEGLAAPIEQLGNRESSELGDSELSRLEGALDAQGTEVLDEGRGGHRPLFPPGPDELSEWAHLLKELPEVEPAVCGMVDGVAHRVDRLRAIGNGVVPDVAALAWKTLYRQLVNE